VCNVFPLFITTGGQLLTVGLPHSNEQAGIVLNDRGPHLCSLGSGNTDGMEHGEHGLDSKVVDHVDHRSIKTHNNINLTVPCNLDSLCVESYFLSKGKEGFALRTP